MTLNLTTLKNGLKIVSDRVDSVETVSLGIWVYVGSRNENPVVNGISHFLEHMAFKGTQRRTALQIVKEIESVGGYLNAYTSREATAYYARVLKNDVPLALDILADILQFSTFQSAEFEKERTVILQEIGQTNDTPDDIIFDHFQETAFPDQPMGRPILGPSSIIKNLRPEDLKEYMDREYHPSKMVVAASGNIDHDTLVRLVEDNLGNYTKKDVSSALLQPAVYKGGCFKESKELEQVHLVLGFKGLSYHQPDYYKAAVLSTLLGGGMSSRLFQEIREKRGLVYSIYSSHSSYQDTGLFTIYAGTGPEDVQHLLPLVLEETQKVSLSATQEELDRSKAQLKAGLMMGLESMPSRCEQMATQVLRYGQPLSTKDLLQRIEGIQLEEITNFCHQMIQSPLTLAVTGQLNTFENNPALAQWLS